MPWFAAVRLVPHHVLTPRITPRAHTSCFTPRLFTPNLFTPRLFTPRLFTSRLFTPNLFTPRLFTSRLFTPHMFTPRLFTPRVFTPAVFTPSVFTPHAPPFQVRGGLSARVQAVAGERTQGCCRRRTPTVGCSSYGQVDRQTDRQKDRQTHSGLP